MVIISSAELRNNMKKYLDIAKNEKVVIQRGRIVLFLPEVVDQFLELAEFPNSACVGIQHI